MYRQFTLLLYCSLGAFLVALAVVAFLSPGRIAPGGPAGIAIILYHRYGISQGLTVFVVNALLMVLGARRMGVPFVMRTCVAVLMQALSIELLAGSLPPGLGTASPLLNTVYGGVLAGVGLALVFKGEAASGGWTLVARLLAGRLAIGLGSAVLLLDLLVVMASAIAFRDIDATLWAGLAIYLTGRSIDLVLTGPATSKLVHIATARPAVLTRALGVLATGDGSIVHCSTLRDAQGEALVVLAVDQGLTDRLIHLVRDVDPSAHVAVLDAAEFQPGQRRAWAPP